MPRRALLLGISAYEDEGLRLPAALNDVLLLADALEPAGFAQSDIKRVTSAQKALTANTLRNEIRTFVDSAAKDDELLIYFSGHGIETDGHRVLVPQDYYRTDPRPRSELLGNEDLIAFARRSRANWVLIVIDACREGVRLALAPDLALPKGVAPPKPTTTSPAAAADEPTVQILYSCGQGELSHAISGDTGHSYFTSAFHDALVAEDEQGTLNHIKDAIQRRLNTCLPPGLHQTVSLDGRPVIGRAGEPGALVLKEGVAARLQHAISVSPWCDAIQKNRAWPAIHDASPGLERQALAMVCRAETLVRSAQTKLPAQRWREADAPLRVGRRLEQLFGAKLGTCLTPPEAALTLVVPFVYEAVLAAAELGLVAHGNPLDPLNTEDADHADRMWLALRAACRSAEHWRR